MARKRSGSEPEEINLNLTPALDVIFNLLAFFVITFNPPKSERNFDVSLPPPKLQEQATKDTEAEFEGELFEDVTITLRARPDGSLESIALHEKRVASVERLVRELQSVRSLLRLRGKEEPSKTLQAATIVASPKLKYRHLLAVVDACYRAEIQKINFGESAEASGTPSR